MVDFHRLGCGAITHLVSSITSNAFMKSSLLESVPPNTESSSPVSSAVPSLLTKPSVSSMSSRIVNERRIERAKSRARAPQAVVARAFKPVAFHQVTHESVKCRSSFGTGYFPSVSQTGASAS